MKKLVCLWGIIFAAVILAGCGDTTSKGKVLVDINGNKITEGTLEFLGDINPRIKAQIASPAGRKRILNNLVEQNLLYQEAVKEGINRDPTVKAKVDLYRRVIIAQSLMEKQIEGAAKKYYEDNQGEFKKLMLSQIMVKYSSPEEIKKAKKTKKGKRAKLHTEKQALKIANDIKAKLDKGESFEKLAKEDSEDPATKSRGGNLGLASKDDKRLAARGYGPLLEKAFEMKVGEISGPIKTSKGYHIITVTRGIELEPYEDAKRSIIIKVRNDTRKNLLARLKKDATIVYPEEELKKKEMEKRKQELEKKAAEEKKGGQVSKGSAEEKAKK